MGMKSSTRPVSIEQVPSLLKKSIRDSEGCGHARTLFGACVRHLQP